MNGKDDDINDVQAESRNPSVDEADAHEIATSTPSEEHGAETDPSGAGVDAGQEPEVTKRNKWWWQRQSVRTLMREYSSGWEGRDGWDDRDNEESRLPSDESVQLGGVTLVEAFTPSTATELYASLKRWQARNPYENKDWVTEVQQRRSSSTGGGWSSLGFVRPPGSFVMGMGFTDPDLPAGVDAVWLSVSYVTPSVGMVCATFTINEKSADLSEVLRTDRRRTVKDVRLIVPGRLGRYRARIPWARPKSHGMTSSMQDSWAQKRSDVEAIATRFEKECGQWFYGNFPGRFATLEPKDRPSVRLIFTETTKPYSDTHRGPLTAVGLGQSWDLFVGAERASAGWWLTNNRKWNGGRHRLWTFAARRSDVGDRNKVDRRGTSNWSMTQAFGTDQVQLVAIHALWVLLDVFAVELSRLRDRANRDRRFARPVRDARELNRYLLTDGLDAATVVPDVLALTRDIRRFRWGVPEYNEYIEPGPDTEAKPAELVPRLGKSLQAKAKKLATNASETDGNLRASAELQQAIANTRMQRVVLVFTVVAVLLAVASLYFALSRTTS